MVNFPASSSSPYTDDNGVVWTWSGSAWGKATVVEVDGITATGTPSASTYLRGDGAWSTPAGGGSATSETAALLPYTTALARVRANTGTCDVLVIGTSISEFGSNGGFPYTTRWQDVFRDLQRQKLFQVPTGGVNYIATQWATTLANNADPPYTSIAGTWDGMSPYGLGLRSSIATTTASRTYTFTCTGFDIVYTGYNGAGQMYYTVDGGAPTVFSQQNAQTTSGLRHQVRGLSDAEHVIVVGRETGGIYFDGLMIYRGDETTGFRVWDSARSGSDSSTFAASNNWTDPISLIQPDLVIIEHGINDVLGAIAPATFRTNVESIISKIRSKTTVDPPIVLMSVWAKDTDPEGTQVPYRTAAQELADDDAGVLFFDGAAVTYTSETLADSDPYGLLEGFHAAPSGSAALALGLSNFLDARSVPA